MTLPDSFQFSSHSLQDYVDCPRRFQLRFLLAQPWPALVTQSTAEMEQHMQRGSDFHHLICQHVLGLDPALLEARIQDETLARWWQTHQAHPPAGLPTAFRRPEVMLSAAIAGYRLVARLDLLAVEPGERAVVVDWKTPLHRPRRSALAKRLQTRVYRYLIVEAGSSFNAGMRLAPEQVELVYWYAEFNGATERFAYDAGEYAADRAYLEGLVTEIAARADDVWSLTPDDRHCLFCNYRSLCERRAGPGSVEELDEDMELGTPDLSLEQIAEVAF